MSELTGLSVYLQHINFPISNDYLVDLQQQATPKRLQRAKRYHNQEDKIRCLLAEQLLKIACHQQGLSKDNQNICQHISTNSFGKPVFDTQQVGYFNLSHSGEWVVCALDKHPVGIDVESCCKPLDMETVNLLSCSEQTYINQANLNDRPARFYRIWTLKESYLKALGVGLYQSLDSFTIHILDEHHAQLVINNNAQLDWYFYYFDLDSSHVCAICAQEPIHQNSFTFT